MLIGGHRPKNYPPPGKKRVGDWRGMRVKSRVPLANGYGKMPAGTIFTVKDTTVGLRLETDPCACCGIQFSICRVRSDDVEPLVDGEQGAAVSEQSEGRSQ